MEHESERAWNLTERQWETLIARVRANADALEDGAFARLGSQDDGMELNFYASALSKPRGWRFPFAEDVPGTRARGALIGRAWHDAATGFVHFETIIPAAAQALRADYESGVDDLDYVAYEQAAEQAMAGTPADADWLEAEFARLAQLTGMD